MLCCHRAFDAFFSIIQINYKSWSVVSVFPKRRGGIRDWCGVVSVFNSYHVRRDRDREKDQNCAILQSGASTKAPKFQRNINTRGVQMGIGKTSRDSTWTTHETWVSIIHRVPCSLQQEEVEKKEGQTSPRRLDHFF